MKNGFLNHNFEGIGMVERINGQDALFSYRREEVEKEPENARMMLRLVRESGAG